MGKVCENGTDFSVFGSRITPEGYSFAEIWSAISGSTAVFCSTWKTQEEISCQSFSTALAELGFLSRKVSDRMVTPVPPGSSRQDSHAVVSVWLLLCWLGCHPSCQSKRTLFTVLEPKITLGFGLQSQKAHCIDPWESLRFLLQTSLVKHKVILELQFKFTHFP